jgi:hypothetical protein
MRCPSCGVELPSTSGGGCVDLYHELSARTLSDRDPTFPHQLAVDAYAAQHATRDAKPITTAFALIGLYLVCERGFTGHEVQRAHMFLGRRRDSWPRFDPPADRGALTVGDMLAAADGERRAALGRWAASVWRAWHEQHARIADLVQERFDRRGGKRDVAAGAKRR